MAQKQIEGWILYYESRGFELIPNGFGGIAKFLCGKNDQFIGFAFAISGFELSIDHTLNDAQLLQLAEKKIGEYLTSRKIQDREEYTFEYRGGGFVEKQDPTWWVKSIR